MIRPALTLALAALFPCGVLAQGTTVTVGHPSTGATFTSITMALSTTAPGSGYARPVTIEVQSVVLPNGKYAVLSEYTGESFPLDVPADTTIVGVGSVPVYIGTTTSGKDLIKIAKHPLGSGKGVVTLTNLRLFGGDTAVLAQAAAVGEEFSVNLTAVEFTKNETALLAEAVAGGKILSSSVSRCRMEDHSGSSLQGVGTLVTSAQEYGLRFRANGNQVGGPGVADTVVDAIVDDFRLYDVVGDFDDVTGEGRLITVEAIGFEGPSEFVQGPDPTTLSVSPVPRVELVVSGGDLDAHRKEGGWRTGLYCLADGAPGSNANYNCSFDVEVYGTLIHEFLDNGVVAVTEERGRGDLTVNGHAKIYETNEGQVPGGTDWFGAGLVGLQSNGFLAIRIFGDSEIHGNRGDGVYLWSRLQEGLLYRPNLELPEGLYGQFSDIAVHNNSGDGIHAKAGGTSGALIEGVVGGGRSWVTGTPYFHHAAKSGAMDYRGQGFVDRCQIHNNGGRGLHFEPDGRGIASLRTVNTIAWNNVGAAWYADLSEADGGHALCSPVMYSTFAGNGDGLDFCTLDVVRPPTGITENYTAPTSPLLPQYSTLHTKFLHSAFQRKNSGLADFGGGLVGMATLPPGPINFVEDSGSPGVPLSKEIAATGCRSADNPHGILLNLPHRWTLTQVAFANTSPGVWISGDPTAFFIPPATNQDNDEVSEWDGTIPFGLSELVVDFGSDPRTPFPQPLGGPTTPHPAVRGAKTQ